ncbi:MAG: T9SS type A sorting domain-containing protein [bacterium]
MKRSLILISMFFVIWLFSMEIKDADKDYRFLMNAYKREISLKQKNPIYSKLISSPSKRSLIDFERKFSTDTVKVLVLKVEFLEDTTSLTTGNGKMDLRGSMDSEYEEDTLFDGEDTIIDTVRNLYFQPPHDSLYFFHQMEALQNYFLDDSHGKLFVDFSIFPKSLHECYTVNHTMVYYGDTTNYVLGLFSLFRDALLEAEIKGGIDFQQFDAVIVFHAGSMWQTDYNYDSPFDLPAVYVQGADYVFGQPITVGGKSFNDAVIYSETANQDGGYAFIQGGLVHEFAHQLGIYDLYDTSGRRMGMGGWALQGTGNWNLNGLVPPHQGSYNAGAKFNANPNSDYSNWIYFNQTITIDRDTTRLKIKYLGANEDSSAKIFRIPINSHEWYHIENRFAYMNPDTLSDRPDSNGFRVWKDGVLVKVDDYDMSLPCPIDSGGLAIYHIDETIILADSGYNMINGGDILGIDMEEADMVQDFELDFYDVYDIEKAFYGSYQDLFFEGGVNDRFTPKTNPNTTANNRGNSHVYIYDVSRSDTLMTFSVLYDFRVKGFPFALKTASDVGSPKVTEIDGKKVIFFQTMAGEIYAIGADGKGAFNESGIVGTFNSSEESYSTPAFGSVRALSSKEMALTSYAGDVHVLRTDTLNSRQVFIEVKGSPITSNFGYVASATMADIDNDSLDEILVCGEDMYLKIIDWVDDSLIVSDSAYLYAGSWSQPIILDDRIITLAFDGVIRGFDFDLNELFSSKTENVLYTMSSPVAVDIDADSVVEIIFVRGDGNLYSVSSETGEIEFRREMPYYPFYTSPVVSDIDNNGEFEISLLLYGKLFLFDYNGNIINNYPVNLRDSTDIQATPIIVDLNDDNVNDILIHTDNGLLEGFSDKTISGFPIATGQQSNSTPIVCDLDNDSFVDIVAVSDYQLIAFELDSRLNSRIWPSQHYNEKNNRYYPYISSIERGTALIIPDENTYIYPNPALDYFIIRFNTDTGKRYSYSIFDQAGTKKMESDSYLCVSGVNEKRVGVNELGAGFYILRLLVENDVEKRVKMFYFTVRK